MAAYAESNASFKSRAKQIQLTDAYIAALDDIDVKCFNHYAFAVCGQPGQFDSAKFQTLVDTVCPAGATVGVQAAPRQLAYESLTVAVAAIRQRIEQPDGALKKLPAEEKGHRLQALKSKITGFEITHEYEPSHSTIEHGCHLETKVTDGVIGCSRGVHECIKCYKGHSYQDCPDTQ